MFLICKLLIYCQQLYTCSILCCWVDSTLIKANIPTFSDSQVYNVRTYPFKASGEVYVSASLCLVIQWLSIPSFMFISIISTTWWKATSHATLYPIFSSYRSVGTKLFVQGHADILWKDELFIFLHRKRYDTCKLFSRKRNMISNPLFSSIPLIDQYLHIGLHFTLS